MGRACRQTKIPGNNIPSASPYEGAKNHGLVNNMDINDALANGVGHMQAEEKKRTEIKKGRINHRYTRGQDPGGNNGGNGIGRIMKAI